MITLENEYSLLLGNPITSSYNHEVEVLAHREYTLTYAFVGYYLYHYNAFPFSVYVQHTLES